MGIMKMIMIACGVTVIIFVALAIPFWFFWTFTGLGKMYFYFLPTVYQEIPFLNCIGLSVLVSILSIIIKQLSPFKS
jgi:hypothetical protein